MTDAPKRCPRTGKVCMTRKQALAQAKWWRGRMLARMNHYRCKSCDMWHIGNDRSDVRHICIASEVA